MTINKRGVYDPIDELEKQGYDGDSLVDELVYQSSNAGVLPDFHDNFYRMGFVGGDEGWTAEEILGECETYGIDLEDYKLDEEE